MHLLTIRIKSLKNYFLTSGVVKNVFFCMSWHQNQVLNKLFISPLEWLTTCFDAFPDYQNQVLKKLFFSSLEGLKTCFDAFSGHQNQVLNTLFFSPLEWFKLCFFMHLRILLDHQNQVLKKNIFITSGVL